MKDTIGLVFSGQGSQKKNMASLCVNDEDFERYVTKISDITGKNIRYLLFDANEDELKNTSNAQIAIFTISYWLGHLFINSHDNHFILAGHSLGQYIAIALSGILSFEDTCRLICKRSELMQQEKGLMLAIIGVDLAEAITIANLSSELTSHCYIANINSNTQIILSGDETSILKAEIIAKQFGKKSVVLATSGPFHTPYMKKQSEQLAIFIDTLEFHESKFPVISNVFASSVIDWKQELKLHMHSPVQWQKSMMHLRDFRIIEIGPSAVLTNLAKRDGYNILYMNEF